MSRSLDSQSGSKDRHVDTGQQKSLKMRVEEEGSIGRGTKSNGTFPLKQPLYLVGLPSFYTFGIGMVVVGRKGTSSSLFSLSFN